MEAMVQAEFGSKGQEEAGILECTGISDHGRNRFMYSAYEHINVYIGE